MWTKNINTIPLQTAASVDGAAVPAQNMLYVSAQIIATGSASGTLQLQASNDYSQLGGYTPTDWNNIGSSVSVTGSGSFLIPFTPVCYQYIRAIYTNTGTGNISVNLFCQGS